MPAEEKLVNCELHYIMFVVINCFHYPDRLLLQLLEKSRPQTGLALPQR
jgi:hypothetical protein